MKKTNIGFVSLGCPKNRVDTETMLGLLSEQQYAIVTDPDDADIIIVNTCAFIDAAKEESIDAILEMAEKKKNRLQFLIVAGCMAERYKDEILNELPEVDAVVGTGDYHKIKDVILSLQEGKKSVLAGHINDEIPEGLPRILSTGVSTAYLKIADGCDNTCTYCIIPKLRGKYRSRPIEDVLDEAQKLADAGVRELIVIAQDTTRYGYDLYGQEMLPALLTRLCQIEGIVWVRVHYMYPESITDSLIDTFVQEEKLVNYMDIPIQHINDRILKLMGRKTTKEQILSRIKTIRARIPDVTLRTSLIAGFPTETEEEHKELLDFIREARFERLGVFAYSQEEDTAAARLSGQLPEEVKNARARSAMQVQKEIALAHAKQKVGKTVTVLTEAYDYDNFMYVGRTAHDSPEVDTTVYFASDDEVEIGTFVKVKILDATDYDVTGVRIEEPV